MICGNLRTQKLQGFKVFRFNLFWIDFCPKILNATLVVCFQRDVMALRSELHKFAYLCLSKAHTLVQLNI